MNNEMIHEGFHKVLTSPELWTSTQEVRDKEFISKSEEDESSKIRWKYPNNFLISVQEVHYL